MDTLVVDKGDFKDALTIWTSAMREITMSMLGSRRVSKKEDAFLGTVNKYKSKSSTRHSSVLKA